MKNFTPQFSKEDQELAPEIEWLLLSQQYSADQVAEELVKLCFTDLYHWMLLCLDEREAAAVAAIRTILAAAENAYRYPGKIGAVVWVFRLGAREIRRSWPRQFWRKAWTTLYFFRPAGSGQTSSLPETSQDAAFWLGVDALPGDHRLVLNLACGLGWEPDRIAQVLEDSSEQADRLLQQALHAVLVKSQAFSAELGQPAYEDPAGLLTASLARRQAQLIYETFDLPEIAAQAAGELAHQARRQSRSLRWKETLWLAGSAGLIVLILWAVNLWLPDTENSPATSGPPRPAQITAGPAAATRTPAAPLPSGPIASYLVQPGDLLDSIASFLGVPLDELRRLNPDVLGQELQPGKALQVMLHRPEQPAFPTPVMPGAHLVTPLDYWLTPQEFFNWLINTPARWVTVWLDGMVVDYGPPGIIRTPDQTPFQAWFSKPDRDLVIWQGSDLSLNRTLTLGEWQYVGNNQAEIEIRKVENPSDWLLNVRYLVSPGRIAFLQQTGEWQLLGVDTLVGRKVLIVDWRPDLSVSQALTAQGPAGGAGQVTRRRLWIDASLGVILRWQELVGEPDQEILLRELLVDNIQYDRVFPRADQFSPWALNDQTFLDHNSTWLVASEAISPVLTQTPVGRARLPQVPPGEGFDPSTAQLTFQYPENASPNQQQVMAELYADSAYLGQIVLSNPEMMICVRSQDGQQVAYTYDPFGNPDIMGIGWFRLEYPLRFNRLEIPLIPDSLAFSPNGRYLAYFAGPLHASPGSLSLIDTQTGRQRQLASLIYANSLMWGPDGKSLAMIVADPEPQMREVRILDVETGTFVYHHKVSLLSILVPGLRDPDWPAADWPARDWGGVFPPPEQGLQDCLQP